MVELLLDSRSRVLDSTEVSNSEFQKQTGGGDIFKFGFVTSLFPPLFKTSCVCLLKTPRVLGSLSIRLLTFNFPMPLTPNFEIPAHLTRTKSDDVGVCCPKALPPGASTVTDVDLEYRYTTLCTVLLALF